MKPVLHGAALLAILLALPGSAEAQRCCYGYRMTYYYAHPHYHALYKAPPPPRWSIGLHVAGLATDQMIHDEAMLLGGLGGNLRFRGYRWGAELAIDGVGGEFISGRIKRISVPLQASALLYLIPEGVFNLYLIGGMRVVPSVISWNYPNLQTDQDFIEFGLHGGVGADLNLGRFFAFTADLRVFGTMRADSEPAGQYYTEVDEAILPKDSTGVQLNLGCAFRF